MRRQIFVNYRKADSRDAAYLIADRLKREYGARNVFIDENLEGAIFSER